MPDVEVGLGAVVGHEDLAVLERVHRARIHVEVRIELLHHHPETACREQVAETRCGESLAQRGNDTTGHEDVLGRVVRIVCAAFIHHGLIVYATFAVSIPTCPTRPPSSARVARMPRSGAAEPHAQAARRRGDLEQLARVREPALGVGEPRQQPRHLGLALGAGELAHARRGDGPVGALDDAQVVRRERGDLREVGHDDDLRTLREAGEPAADLDGGGAADAGVDLVEDEGRHRIGAGDDHLDREHDPRELAARRARRDRTRLGARVRPQEDRDLVAAVRDELGGRLDRDGELCVGHRERRELGRHRSREARCGVGAQLGERGPRVDRRRRSRCSTACLESVDAIVVAVELDEPERRPCRRKSRRSSSVPPWRRSSAAEHGTTLLHDLELARAVGVEAGEVARQLGRGIRERRTRRRRAPRRSARARHRARRRGRGAVAPPRRGATASGASSTGVSAETSSWACAAASRRSSRLVSRSARSCSSTSSPGCGSAASSSSSAARSSSASRARRVVCGREAAPARRRRRARRDTRRGTRRAPARARGPRSGRAPRAARPPSAGAAGRPGRARRRAPRRAPRARRPARCGRRRPRGCAPRTRPTGRAAARRPRSHRRSRRRARRRARSRGRAIAPRPTPASRRSAPCPRRRARRAAARAR